MQVTEVFDVNNEIRCAVFKKWQERDITSASSDTSAKVTGVWSQGMASTQAQALNVSFLSKVAEGWQLMEDHLLEKPFNPLPDSSLDFTSFEKCSLLFNEDVIKFCAQSGIVRECLQYHKIFLDTFKHIKEITVTISHDYELPDYQKINFILTLSDEIDNVLGCEDIFKRRIRQEIGSEKRRFFTYNYNLI
jgi:hypothetical protein